LIDSTSIPAIPESNEVYNWEAAQWEAPPGGTSRIPLIGAMSYIGSVTTASTNAPAAFRLLAWLSAQAGGRTGRLPTPVFRTESADELTAAAFSQESYLQVPRLIEVDAYLAALDESVRLACQGELSAKQALASTAQKWDEITERVGRERQRAVYQNHLNLQ
jgi:hypothetical protein